MIDAHAQSHLNHLIEVCRDGEQGFTASAEHAVEPRLATLLKDYAKECGEGSRELQAYLQSHGVEPKRAGSTGGTVQRGWASLRAVLAARDGLVILDECERAEEIAKKAYETALNATLPEDAHAMVRRHYEGVLAHYGRIVRLKEDYLRGEAGLPLRGDRGTSPEQEVAP